METLLPTHIQVCNILMFLMTLLFADDFATHVLKRPGISLLIRLAFIVIVGNTFVGTASSIFNGLDEMDGTALISVT
ncbi:hypothetical protein KEJ48_02880 [Candidatus Bathyarchaeota archaeon]|nr:hypothetical protein [Candidatus Bathyarchaeota archaeon]